MQVRPHNAISIAWKWPCFQTLSLTLQAFARALIRSSSAALARAIATEFVDAHEPNDETEPVGDFPLYKKFSC